MTTTSTTDTRQLQPTENAAPTVSANALDEVPTKDGASTNTQSDLPNLSIPDPGANGKAGATSSQTPTHDQVLALAKLRIIEKQLQRLRDDPAGVAIEMPWIQERVKAWDDAKRSGDAVNVAKAYSRLMRGLESEQIRRGISPEDRAVLPVDMIEGYARSIYFETKPEERLGRYREIVDQHAEYGEGFKRQFDRMMPGALLAAAEHRSKLVGELMWRQTVARGTPEDMLPDELVAASGIRSPIARGAQPSGPRPMQLKIPRAVLAGGKVTQGVHGSMRAYRLNGRAFLVPSGESEGDILLGVDSLALEQEDGATLTNDSEGRGLILFDRFGVPVGRYSWEELRNRSALAIIPRAKWTARQPDPTKLDKQAGPYHVITLHHTGTRTSPHGVLDLHTGNISLTEKVLRRIGSQFGVAQSYDDYGDVGYHFLIDENGRIYEGRPLEYQGAHVARNKGNLGIAFLGDYSERPLNPAQLRSLEFLIRSLGPRLGLLPDPRGGGLANAGIAYTHGDLDERKRDELGGAKEQLEQLLQRMQGPYRR